MARRTYRSFDGQPLFPFGFGPSYTTPVHLKPGEQQTVSFALKDRDLSHVSPEDVHLVRAGRYGISVGGGQPDTGAAVATAAFDIQGERTLPR